MARKHRTKAELLEEAIRKGEIAKACVAVEEAEKKMEEAHAQLMMAATQASLEKNPHDDGGMARDYFISVVHYLTRQNHLVTLRDGVGALPISPAAQQ